MDTKPKSSPRDVFLHLLLIGTLYVVTFQFLQLVFGLIDVAFPDPLNRYFNPGSSLRWAIATLIIVFPVFLWTARFLGRDLAVRPEKKDLRVRKWLLYLTLFLAAILIIGDLVALIFNFLEGDLTARFMLKAFAVLVVAIVIFRYYLWEIRRDPAQMKQVRRGFGIGTSIAIVAAIVGGVFIAGSPFKQRLVRFDAQKVGDLQSIQWQIVNYWQQKDALPPTLDALRDDISGFVPPRDPQIGEAYGYTVKDTLSFELCATFNRSSGDVMAEGGVPTPAIFPAEGETWEHPVGIHCFSRTIDPELYRNPINAPAKPRP